LTHAAGEFEEERKMPLDCAKAQDITAKIAQMIAMSAICFYIRLF